MPTSEEFGYYSTATITYKLSRYRSLCAFYPPYIHLNNNYEHSSAVAEEFVKAQVKDLHYNSSNLYPNCIIRQMLMKWSDHPPGICRQGIRMV